MGIPRRLPQRQGSRTVLVRGAGLLAILIALTCPPARAADTEIGSPAHRAQAAILSLLITGPLGVITLPTPACSNATSGAPTVATDLAFYLTALSRGGHVMASCEPGPPGAEACRVTVGQSISSTEIRWSRLYEFIRSVEGRVEPETLGCLTVP